MLFEEYHSVIQTKHPTVLELPKNTKIYCIMNMKAATGIFYVFLGFTLETILSEYFECLQ